jgi:hypothetical protein
MTPTTSPQASRDRAAGIGRFGGMLTAAVTAGAVFLGGRQFLVPTAGPEVLTPTSVTEAQMGPPPSMMPDAGGSSATGVDAAAAGDAAATGATTTTDAGAAALKVDPAPDESAAQTKTDKPADDVNQAHKDLARESWRRNKPDISVANGQSTILVPLKGSSEGATQKYLRRTHTLVITLPKAASLNTMHFYKLNRDGFSVLWTDQEETNAKAADGTKLRLVFAQHSVPDVEIRDDFVRVTIARPAPVKAAPAEKAEANEGSAPDKDKDKDKDERPKDAE